MTLVQGVLEGNRLALARLLTQIENRSVQGREALDELFPHTGKAHLIGVTGAPGTGKSSLVNQLAFAYRHSGEGVQSKAGSPAAEPKRVAIVAIDPSSPFTGGAILGDRVRMRDLAGDPGVFIRSMAARGSLGGLAAATSGLVQAFDAAGFEVIMIETVGAGQDEVDIARLAHTTLVVEAPGLGDDIQAIKAGILEIADVLVINKADRPGVESTERALRSMLQLAHPSQHVFQDAVVEWGHKAGHGVSHSAARLNWMGAEPEKSASQPETKLWIPPIRKTVAPEGTGVMELMQDIESHRRHLEETGELGNRERSRLKSELDLMIRDELVGRWRERVEDGVYERVVQRLVNREISPWQAVDELVAI